MTRTQRRDLGILCGTEDFTLAEGNIECIAIGSGFSVLGLMGGRIQGVSVAVKQTLFKVACVYGGRVCFVFFFFFSSRRHVIRANENCGSVTLAPLLYRLVSGCAQTKTKCENYLVRCRFFF